MTLRSYFDKMNSTLGSVVPLVMFIKHFGADAGILLDLLDTPFLTRDFPPGTVLRPVLF